MLSLALFLCFFFRSLFRSTFRYPGLYLFALPTQEADFCLASIKTGSGVRRVATNILPVGLSVCRRRRRLQVNRARSIISHLMCFDINHSKTGIELAEQLSNKKYPFMSPARDLLLPVDVIMVARAGAVQDGGFLPPLFTTSKCKLAIRDLPLKVGSRGSGLSNYDCFTGSSFSLFTSFNALHKFIFNYPHCL